MATVALRPKKHIMWFRIVQASVKGGAPPKVTFSSAYLSSLERVLTNYWSAQSGGRQVITWQPHMHVTVSSVEPAEFWKRYDTQADLVSEMVRDEVLATTAIAPDEALAIVLHGAPSSAGPGVTGKHGYPLVLAGSLSASTLGHEMGHYFQDRTARKAHGNYHANVLPELWVEEYGDQSCLMGSEGHGGGAKLTFHEPSLRAAAPAPPGLDASFDLAGPGMCPPMVETTHWLDTSIVGATIDASSLADPNAAPRNESLQPWVGAPTPDAGQDPTLIYADGLAPSGDRIYVSVRSALKRWDQGFLRLRVGLADSPTTSVWAHELLPSRGSVRLVRIAAVPGQWARLRRAPFSVKVLEAGGGGANLELKRDPWRGFDTLIGAQFELWSRVGAVARRDTVEVFGIATDGFVRTLVAESGTWNRDWTLLDGEQFSTTAGIAAVSRTPDTVEVYAVGQDNQVKCRHFHDGEWEASWETLDTADLDQRSSLAAARVDERTAELVATTASGRVVRTIVRNRHADTWEVTAPLFDPASSVAALPREDGRTQIHAVRRGPAHARLWSLPAIDPDGRSWEPHRPFAFDDTRAIGATALEDGGQLIAVAGDLMLLRILGPQGWATEDCPDSGSGERGGIAAASPNGRSVCIVGIGEDGLMHPHWRDPNADFVAPTGQVDREVDVMILAPDGHLVSAENGGGAGIRADRANVLGAWERFHMSILQGMVEHGVAKLVFTLRVADGHLVTAENGGGSLLTAKRTWIGDWEKFRLVATVGDKDSSTWRGSIEAFDGSLWRAEGGGGSGVSANGTVKGDWETFNIAVIA